MATDTGESLLQALRLAEQQLATVNAEILAAQQVLTNLNREIAEAEAERDDVVNYCAGVKSNIVVYEADQAALTASNDALKAEQADLETRNAAMRHELEQSKAELAALTTGGA